VNPPPNRDTRARRLLWTLFLLGALAPFVFAGVFLVWNAVDRWPLAGLGLLEVQMAVVAAAAFGISGAAVRWSLRRRWHLRSGLLAAAGLVAFAVVALVAGLAVSRRGGLEDGAVKGNAGALAAAAGMHFLEHGGISVSRAELVGPDRYIKALNQVNREIYPTHFTLGHTITVTGIAGSRTITYAP
jgi:hypothetical protein